MCVRLARAGTSPRLGIVRAATVNHERQLVLLCPAHREPCQCCCSLQIAMWAPRCSELTCTPEASASGARDGRACGARPVAGVREGVAVADCLPAPPSAVSSSISSSWQLHITSTQPCQLSIYTRIESQTTAESRLSCTAPAPLYSVHTATSLLPLALLIFITC